jgi:molybdopterin-guanine dinucleotide biosynthesis protein A
MPDCPGVLGAVLAGGESRRFGSDKTAQRMGPSTLLERAVGTLAEVFGRVVIVSSDPSRSVEGVDTIPDLRVGLGPLAGLESALAHASEVGLHAAFLLAADLPLVTAPVVRSICGALEDANAAAPARDGRHGIEPLCAVYAVACLPEVRAALGRGERALHRVFETVGGHRLDLQGDAFLNVNTPSELEEAMTILDIHR